MNESLKYRTMALFSNSCHEQYKVLDLSFLKPFFHCQYVMKLLFDFFIMLIVFLDGLIGTLQILNHGSTSGCNADGLWLFALAA